MAANPERRYTLEEYFELERTSNERFEFWNGEVFSMGGASESHDRIVINLIVHLSMKLDSARCRVFSADMRIKVPSAPPYRYADFSALCGKAQFEEIGGVAALTNPQLLIEVLSPSTEAYDRGDKFTHYKSIPALHEYLLVAQHRTHVTQFTKQDDGSWKYDELNDLTSTVKVASLNCELPLDEIYRGVNFDAEPAA